MDGINRRAVFLVRLAIRFCCLILVSVCRRVPPTFFLKVLQVNFKPVSR
jgi:hypothetical protein